TCLRAAGQRDASLRPARGVLPGGLEPAGKACRDRSRPDRAGGQDGDLRSGHLSQYSAAHLLPGERRAAPRPGHRAGQGDRTPARHRTDVYPRRRLGGAEAQGKREGREGEGASSPCRARGNPCLPRGSSCRTHGNPRTRGRVMKGFLLSAEGLHKRYGEREVVCDVALQVASGEVIGLLGPNGAGKTTTFNMIVGRIRPTAGRVRLGERDITDLPMYRRARLGITYLPQEPSIFRRLSVSQNVLAILETVEPDSSLRRERLRELLGELGLQDKAHLRGDALSGGERRRVEITRALVLDPKFMLLDEPFSGIDPIAVIDIQKIIEQLKARGIGIIITDHNVRE